ncbi:MAG: VCBS repeat-containing protein [Thermoguttaceae bacterium]
MNCRRCLATLPALAVLLAAAPAAAMINPHFTPVHLVKQAGLIVSVDLKQGASKDQYLAAIREVLKGKTDLKALRLDLSKAINTQNADALRELAAGGKPALLFVGEFAEEKGGGVEAAATPRGLLHLAGQWAEFDGGQDGVWAFRQIDSKSQAVWAGGSDMLRRAVDYILEDDDPEVPVVDGAAWSSDQKKIAALDGKIRAVRPIDLAGDGKLVLFVARDQGDHLLVCDPKSRNFSDITAARRLQSKSRAFAWGDFSGRGRLDLISFDGRALALSAQQADGTFQARPLELAAALENGCIGLAALDCGTPAPSPTGCPAGLLVSTRGRPLRVAFDPAGKPAISILAAPGVDLAKLGPAGPCLVADFNGDGLPDVLQLFAAGSVLYRGQGPGKFAPGTACAVKLGTGEAGACVADFAGEGRFGVLAVSTDAVRLWQNEGDGKFVETLNLSGEIAYISKPGGIECMVGDINNDGRQDALIAYSAASPQLFFNRGYRSFGHAHTLDLAERQLLPVAEQGQQSACLGDFDGDGAQDMVLALTSGEIWVFFRENEDHEAHSVIAALPAGGRCKGPVTVTGWNGKRCLGAWNVLPGTSQAFFGRREAGPVTLKWRLPGGPEQKKEVVVEKEMVRVEIR